MSVCIVYGVTNSKMGSGKIQLFMDDIAQTEEAQDYPSQLSILPYLALKIKYVSLLSMELQTDMDTNQL